MDPPGIHVLSRNPDVYLNFTLSRSIDSLLPLPGSILLPLNLARERNAMPQLSNSTLQFVINSRGDDLERSPSVVCIPFSVFEIYSEQVLIRNWM